MIEVIGGGVVEDGIVIGGMDIVHYRGFANGRLSNGGTYSQRSANQVNIVVAFIRRRRPPSLRTPPPPV
jgi:hypothetical protein